MIYPSTHTHLVLGIKREAEDDNPEMMETTTTTTTEELPLHEQNPSLYYPTVPGTMSCIGSIEINKESTVNELKELIMTLPQVSVCISIICFAT